MYKKQNIFENPSQEGIWRGQLLELPVDLLSHDVHGKRRGRRCRRRRRIQEGGAECHGGDLSDGRALGRHVEVPYRCGL